MYFRNYGVQKSWLDKWLKSHVSEGLATSNMVNENFQAYINN